jgi:hypothetical protein
MYYIKVVLKRPNISPPLLSDLLYLFQEGFNYILQNLRTFYNPEDHNIAFLTLYQEPMINALNTGGFDLQDSISEMVERILKMLQQFLISNSSLRLNNSFKVYVKVMSIEHMKFKQNRRKKINPRKKFGTKPKEEKKIYWQINVPDGFGSKTDVFTNKCLLTATILGHLQNCFYKSKRKDKRFLYLQNLNSKFEAKKIHACKILLKEMNDIFTNTEIINEGPYELEKTAKILSTYFKCQFFIFDAIDNSHKLSFMFPYEYDDSLEPIYLFQPLNQPNHVIFIRHLKSYFKSNFKICFYCKKSFKSHRYNHFCVKMKGCFACHRPFAKNSTFLHEKNIFNFCDKNISNEQYKTCDICNVTLYSKHCQQGHKLLCCGKGSFGWKCLKCKKFSYRYGKLNATIMKETHVCGIKKCIYCFQNLDDHHLCKLKLESFPKNWPLIAFIGIEHADISIQNCIDCCKIKRDFQRNKNSKEFLSNKCLQHAYNDIISEPILIVIYKEVKRGQFMKYVLSSSDFFTNDFTEENTLCFDYLNSEFTSIHDFVSLNTKSKKKSFDFNENFKTLQNKNSNLLSVSDKFVQLITKEEWHNTTFVSQDCNSQTYNTILSAFLKNGFCPKVIQNGRKIIFMEIENFSLRFITSNSFLAGTEYDLAKQYEVQFEEYYFPESLKKPEYFHYIGNVPDVEHFYSFYDDNDIKIRKQKYVETLKLRGCNWNFEKELFRFCDEKIWFLTISCLKFLEECFNFQIMMKNENKLKTKELLHPFGYQICSLPGFTYKLFKILYLNNEDIFIVKNEYGINAKNVSKIEYEWASFMEHKYPQNQFLSAFNNAGGQQYFKEAIPDLYSPVTKEAHFFHGCKWHGHLNSCLLFPNATNESKNPVGVTYKTLNEDFLKKAANLLKNNTEKIKKVTIHWECLYLKQRENNELRFFLQYRFKPHPLRRLCPRSCVRGAYIDIYALKWSSKMFPNENFHFYDVNSLYSFAAMKFPYFTSKYSIIIGKELDNIEFINQAFFYKGKQIFGTMLVTILPPKNLFLPVLPLKTSDGKSVNTLCSKCVENYLINCSHSDTERAITESYFISEIIYAIKHKYTLLYIHECHSYENVKFIFKDFVEKINVLKLQNSDCLSNCLNVHEKQEYCDYLNTQMDLKHPFVLTPQNVKSNPGKRNFFKSMANGFFGKFSQKQAKSKTIFASNQQELENIYFSGVEVRDIFSLNDNFCQVQIKPNDLKLPPNRKGNCYLGGQITAYARQIMHEHLTEILRVGGTLYQTDTDSICFSLPQSESIPLLTSHCIGHFKNEINGKIVSYHSLGPKNYSIVYEKNNVFYSTTKIRGLSLKNHVNIDKINDDTFDFFLKQFAQSKVCKKKVIQSRLKRTKCDPFQIHPHFEEITFTNDVSHKRFVNVESKNFVTFPYGYKTQ